MAEAKKVPLEVVGANECPTFYANVTAVRATPHDFQIVMCEVLESNAEHTVARAVARAIMSPEQGQILIKQIQASIDGFVERFGPLREKAVEAVQIVPVSSAKVTAELEPAAE
jgi:hypothetical protein